MAVRRELREEIAFEAGELAFLGRFTTPEGFTINVFTGTIAAPLAALALNEGVDLRYFAPEAFRDLPIAEWQRAVLLRHCGSS